MISVEVQSVVPGKCTWCGKDKDEVVTFAFADKSFSGSMCWNDLKRALKMKVQARNGQPEQTAARASVPVIATATSK